MRSFGDVRFGLRTMAKSPTVTTVSALTLAMGIGVNATVFTLSNAVLFRGFPFDQSDRILYLGERNTTRNQRIGGASYPDFCDWRARAKSFEGMGAANGMRATISDQTGLPESYQATQISANLFRLIGQKPFVGRDFTAADEARGSPQVAILTFGLWERRYGRDPAVVGRRIRINSAPATIIGVMAKDFSFPFNQELWMPLTPTDAFEKRENRFVIGFGRMAKGVNVKAARAEIEGIGRNLASAYPLTNQNFAPVDMTYNEFYLGPMVSTIFETMLVAVGFVLLIACANVANL